MIEGNNNFYKVIGNITTDEDKLRNRNEDINEDFLKDCKYFYKFLKYVSFIKKATTTLFIKKFKQ